MLGLGYGAVTCLSRFGTVVATLIYIAIITLTGVSLAYLFSSGATIFVIVGIMFSLNALFIFYLNISSGLFRPLIFMAVSGIIAAIVVNSLVASSTMVWIVSMLTVLVWTLITALEKSTLHGYADAPRDKCAPFREINGIAAAFQYSQKNYNPTASSFL